MCLFYIVLLSTLAAANQNIQVDSTKWQVHFSPDPIEVNMNTEKNVTASLSNVVFPLQSSDYKFVFKSRKPNLANVDKMIIGNEINESGIWNGTISINGIFLGNTQVYVELLRNNNNFIEHSKQELNIIITRKVRTIDHVFTGSVALLVSILYINFGAALDLTAFKGILLRPIGPAIGFFGQFLLMPIISYILGYVLFPEMPEAQLGLFFTGVSPGGGASNIWTVILQGNINLSIAMTTVSTFAAFGMMPFWIFTLGRVIFDRGNLGVPYDKIGTFAIALIIPLAIGVAIQRYMPRLAKCLVRLLKPISILLILFIVIFAIVTNLYLFQLFSWQIVLGGLGLPLLGYTLSWIVAKLLKQSPPDSIAIAVETGIQNTGIAIFLLRFTLPQPQADLTTVLPVAVAIMTPLPLLLLYIIQKCTKQEDKENESIVRSGSNDS